MMPNNSRGFIFTVDMIFGALVVVLLVSILLNSSRPPIPLTQTFLQIQAKDASMAWFYGAPPSDPSNPFDKPTACDFAFRPNVTTVPLDPSSALSWIYQQNCVVLP